MLTITRCTGNDDAFRALVTELDAELDERYGAQMEFFGQYNHSSDIETALVASLDGVRAGCGCFKPYSDNTVEIKRIFVPKRFRSQGVARAVMAELESWARELGYAFAILETGILQPEAIRLYQAAGYERIPNYPPYENVKESVSFRKVL
jgi:GNAT superfamily N-acetyltransferase